MNDFESRLGEALASGAERAPGAEGLADLARGRAGRRRRTTLSVVAAAVAVAVAVPVGALALRDDAPGAGFAGDANGTGPVAGGWACPRIGGPHHGGCPVVAVLVSSLGRGSSGEAIPGRPGIPEPDGHPVQAVRRGGTARHAQPLGAGRELPAFGGLWAGRVTAEVGSVDQSVGCNTKRSASVHGAWRR